MSINFENPMNDKAREFMKELFGEPSAADEKTALFEKISTLTQEDMSTLARKAGQPVTFEIHGEGDIKVFSDGTKYQVTPQGWKRIE